MPLPALAFLGITLTIGLASLASSIGAAVIEHRKEAQRKLKPRPKGVPRPPPGMTRTELKQAAHERLGMDVTHYFNFAFCGGSGAGKSTLINALLNREDVDFVEGKPHNMFGSAPTGVWQTTPTTLCYAYPNGHDLQHVRLWDMAGCGTHEHPSANYFEEKVLFAFDVLMVVAEKELGEYEYKILENAQKQGIPAIIIITKAEEKVESKIRKLYNTRNPPLNAYKHIVQETTNEARQRVSTCLLKKGLHDAPTFIVSAWNYRDLMKDIEALMNIDHEETISHEEVCGDTSVGEEVSVQEIHNENFGDYEARLQETTEQETRIKTTLLSFELFQLLEFIASTAVQRRL